MEIESEKEFMQYYYVPGLFHKMRCEPQNPQWKHDLKFALDELEKMQSDPIFEFESGPKLTLKEKISKLLKFVPLKKQEIVICLNCKHQTLSPMLTADSQFERLPGGLWTVRK